MSHASSCTCATPWKKDDKNILRVANMLSIWNHNVNTQTHCMSAPVSVILQWSENLSGDLVCFIFINLI